MSTWIYLKDCHKCSSCGHVEAGENSVYERNITNNLINMGNAAGIGDAIWSPEDIKATKAKHIIDLLQDGLDKMIGRPEHFSKFNAANGFGTYEGMVNFVHEYLKACKDNPEAFIKVSR